MSLILTMVGFSNTMLHLDEIGQRQDAFHKGYSIGKKAKSIIGVDWNNYWDWPIDKVRAEFGISIV
jgi:ubiquinone biosynthesis protein Coq4